MHVPFLHVSSTYTMWCKQKLTDCNSVCGRTHFCFALLGCMFTGSLRDFSHLTLFFLLEYMYGWFNALLFHWSIYWGIHSQRCNTNLKASSWTASLTFDNQYGRGGQALHISVNNTDVLPSMVQLDVANHQIPWYTLEDILLLRKIRLSKRYFIL